MVEKYQYKFIDSQNTDKELYVDMSRTVHDLGLCLEKLGVKTTPSEMMASYDIFLRCIGFSNTDADDLYGICSTIGKCKIASFKNNKAFMDDVEKFKDVYRMIADLDATPNFMHLDSIIEHLPDVFEEFGRYTQDIIEYSDSILAKVLSSSANGDISVRIFISVNDNLIAPTNYHDMINGICIIPHFVKDFECSSFTIISNIIRSKLPENETIIISTFPNEVQESLIKMKEEQAIENKEEKNNEEI